MEAMLYGEINILCIILLSILTYRAVKVGIDSTPEKRAFLFSICFAIAMNFFDFLWNLGLTKTVKTPAATMYIINALYFVSLFGSSFCWYIFSELVRNKKIIVRKFSAFLMALPFAALLFLIFSTPFTGWVFKIGADGERVRGPLYICETALAFFYMLVASVKNLWYVVSANDEVKRETHMTIFIFSIPTLICVLLQSVFQDMPIISTFPTISFLLIYTNSVQLQLSLDPLTGIGNRRALIGELAKRIKTLKKNSNLFFVFLDIDKFKEMNDTYGHYEGDRVLQITADVLQNVCVERDGFCARYGGDEFAVVLELPDNADVNEVCSDIQSRIREQTLKNKFKFIVNVSCGYGEYPKDGSSIQALIGFADKQMYLIKKKKNAKSRV